MATVFPLTRRVKPPTRSNIFSMIASSPAGSYVAHVATDTGDVGAAAARSHDVPASHAPEAAAADWSSHSLRVCSRRMLCLLAPGHSPGALRLPPSTPAPDQRPRRLPTP